jgi:hypothetical protein
VRTDGFALVGRDEIPLRALPGEDREVILPEVDEHFLELSLTPHGARDFRDLHLGQDATRFLRGSPKLEGVLA